MTTIYYLPGNRGELHTGLGEELLNRGFDVSGRETRDEFRQLPFANQIELVARDLQRNFWDTEARVVANSFGAYLFLHAQMLMPPFVGKVLLLSPIVGEAADVEQMRFFVVPRSGKLHQLAEAGTYPTPLCCEIHVGEHDWQSNPERVRAFANPLSIPVNVVPNGGHMLDRGYIQAVLDRWLPKAPLS